MAHALGLADRLASPANYTHQQRQLVQTMTQDEVLAALREAAAKGDAKAAAFLKTFAEWWRKRLH